MLIASLSKLMLHTSEDRMFVKNILLKETDILKEKYQEYWCKPLVNDFQEMNNLYL
jgi:hypothetical protein